MNWHDALATTYDMEGMASSSHDPSPSGERTGAGGVGIASGGAAGRAGTEIGTSPGSRPRTGGAGSSHHHALMTSIGNDDDDEDHQAGIAFYELSEHKDIRLRRMLMTRLTDPVDHR